MSKAENFIEDCTRTYSNELSDVCFQAWITPEEALRAVEIAREESIEKVKTLLFSEVLPCFMHGGEADEVVAMLDEKLLKDE